MRARNGGGKGLRVAILAPRASVLGHDPYGGSEVVLREDRDILDRAGIPTAIYARAKASGSAFELLPTHGNFRLLTSLEYCGRYVLREPRAVLLSYNEPTVAGLAPERSVIRFDWATPLPRYWNLPFWLGRFQRSLYLFPSHSEREIFLAVHPKIPADRAVLIPNSVDTTLFAPRSEPIPVPRVGFAGQWVARKGVETLLDAWEIVHRNRPEAELWLAGGANVWKAWKEIPGAAEVASRIRSRAQNNVRLVGELPREQMPGFWNCLTVAAVPSTYEPFGLVALEALACGVPVVASRVGGLPEVVAEGECGLLVPPEKPDELARALLALLDNEPLRRRYAVAARERALRFSLESRGRELLRLLENRMAGKSRAPVREPEKKGVEAQAE